MELRQIITDEGYIQILTEFSAYDFIGVYKKRLQDGSACRIDEKEMKELKSVFANGLIFDVLWFRRIYLFGSEMFECGFRLRQ